MLSRPGLGCAFYSVVILLGAVAWLTIFVLVRALALLPTTLTDLIAYNVDLRVYDFSSCVGHRCATEPSSTRSKRNSERATSLGLWPAHCSEAVGQSRRKESRCFGVHSCRHSRRSLSSA